MSSKPARKATGEVVSPSVATSSAQSAVEITALLDRFAVLEMKNTQAAEEASKREALFIEQMKKLSDVVMDMQKQTVPSSVAPVHPVAQPPVINLVANGPIKEQSVLDDECNKQFVIIAGPFRGAGLSLQDLVTSLIHTVINAEQYGGRVNPNNLLGVMDQHFHNWWAARDLTFKSLPATDILQRYLSDNGILRDTLLAEFKSFKFKSGMSITDYFTMAEKHSMLVQASESQFRECLRKGLLHVGGNLLLCCYIEFSCFSYTFRDEAAAIAGRRGESVGSGLR